MLCLAREINSHVQQLGVGVKGLVGHLSDLISVFFSGEIRLLRTTVTDKYATAHDQNHVTVHFFPRSPAATVSC